MPPPSSLQIATSALLRLVSEKASYHTEALQQEARIKKLQATESGDENAEYIIKQEVCIVCVRKTTTSELFVADDPRKQRALEETNALFPSLKQKITDAVTRLEEQLVSVDIDYTLTSLGS
jgi:tubulin-specific chaperone A